MDLQLELTYYETLNGSIINIEKLNDGHVIGKIIKLSYKDLDIKYETGHGIKSYLEYYNFNISKKYSWYYDSGKFGGRSNTKNFPMHIKEKLNKHKYPEYFLYFIIEGIK